MRRVTVHLLAVWVAMCCCQWRAVASCLGMQAMPSCCAAVEAEPTCCDEGCCDDENPSPSPSESGSCAGCCDKGPAPAAEELPPSLFDLHLDHLGTLLLHVPGIDRPSNDRTVDRGTVWHPPPGRFRPLVCILTV